MHAHLHTHTHAHPHTRTVIWKGAVSEMQAVAFAELRNFDTIFCYLLNDLFRQTTEVYKNRTKFRNIPTVFIYYFN
jgi:hypothetical protein